jgi:hypothetical protein
MSNPDSLTVAVPVSIFFLFVTLILFQFRDSIPFFKRLLWVIFPIITLFIVSGVNMITQYISCKKINANKAFLGTVPSLITILIGLGIATIPYCRIPIATVIAPIIIGDTVDITMNKSNSNNINSLKNTNFKECCSPKLSLEKIESRYPLVIGLSYGFYIVFSVLFGVTIGNGISSIC